MLAGTRAGTVSNFEPGQHATPLGRENNVATFTIKLLSYKDGVSRCETHTHTEEESAR